MSGRLTKPPSGSASNPVACSTSSASSTSCDKSDGSPDSDDCSPDSDGSDTSATYSLSPKVSKLNLVTSPVPSSLSPRIAISHTTTRPSFDAVASRVPVWSNARVHTSCSCASSSTATTEMGSCSSPHS